MQKPGSFIRDKFAKLFFVNLLAFSSYSMNLMIDAILGGNQLGETALTAVSIVAPLFSVVYFFEYMFSPGYGVLYGKHLGAFETEEAYKTAGQSVLHAFMTAVFLVLSLLLIRKPYLAYYNCTGALQEEATIYFNWVIVYAAIHPFNVALYYLTMADSDSSVVFFSTISEILLNAFLSFFLCRRVGIAGLGIATAIAAAASTLVYPLHLLRRTNSIRFRFHFSRKAFFSALKLSISRSAGYLFIGLVDILVNKVILITCSESLIPAYSVINLAFSVFQTCGAVFDSAEGFLASYLGERNNYGIRSVMRIVVKTAALTSLALSALFFFCAPLFPRLYGMTSAETVLSSVRAARTMAFTALPFGFCFIGVDLYATLEHPGMSMLLCFLNNLLCPLLLSVPLAFRFGFTGITLGMALSSYLVAVLFSVPVRSWLGKAGFPLYLPDYGEDAVGFDLTVNAESITKLRKAIANAAAQHGFDTEPIDQITDALYGKIMEANPKKKVLSEYILLFGKDKLRVIIRDNGRIVNFLNEKDSVFSEIPQKSYALTNSFNRNGFVFSR